MVQTPMKIGRRQKWIDPPYVPSNVAIPDMPKPVSAALNHDLQVSSNRVKECNEIVQAPTKPGRRQKWVDPPYVPSSVPSLTTTNTPSVALKHHLQQSSIHVEQGNGMVQTPTKTGRRHKWVDSPYVPSPVSSSDLPKSCTTAVNAQVGVGTSNVHRMAVEQRTAKNQVSALSYINSGTSNNAVKAFLLAARNTKKACQGRTTDLSSNYHLSKASHFGADKESINLESPAANTVNTTPSKTRLTLLGLPDDVLLKIMEYTLTHPTPVTVTPRWECLPHQWSEPYNCSALHACHDLYWLGIQACYKANTWVVELNEMEDQWTRYFLPEPGCIASPTLETLMERRRGGIPEVIETWQVAEGIPVAAREARQLILRSNYCANLGDAVQFLRGFQRLEGVVFDMRSDGKSWGYRNGFVPNACAVIDEEDPNDWGWGSAPAAPAGVDRRTKAQRRRDERRAMWEVEMRPWSPWEVVPASEEVLRCLIDMGAKVPLEHAVVDTVVKGVWVGHETAADARRLMALLVRSLKYCSGYWSTKGPGGRDLEKGL